MPLCPRSYFSLKNLKREIGKTPDDFGLEIKSAFFTKQNKKLFFPPLIVCNNQFLSGIYLSAEKIDLFLRSLNG